ncbi:reverse transcriptase domain-containing protein [Tanacetum coccineum]
MYVTRVLSQKGSRVGKGVKEKQGLMADKSSEGSKHVDEELGTNSATRTPNIVNAGLGSYPTLFEAYGHSPASANEVDMNDASTINIVSNNVTMFSSMDGLNAMLENGPWFIFNNPLILKKWNPDVNLLKNYVANVPVWVKLHDVPVTAFSEDGLSAIATKLGTPLMLDSYTSYMCMQSCGRSSYARSMIELLVDVELKDNIVVAMPKLAGSGEAKNLEKPSQAPRGVSVGPKVGFKPAKQVYRPVSKNPTTNTSGNKKKDVEPTKEVSNSNLFDVLNSVENDVDLGTNGGTSNLASKEAIPSGSSFCNVETSSTSTTPIDDKTRKLEKLIIDGKVTLVDDEGKPLKKVDYPGDHDSEDEVESVDNDMSHFLALERGGFGTNSLLEQWRDTYENVDYDYDPYDDDMNEGEEIPDKIQSICDNLDIKDASVVSSPAVDEPVVAVRNTKDVNVGQTLISVIVDPNLDTSYAKLFTGESSRNSVNFRTLIIQARTETDVVGRSSYARAIIELRTDVELKDTIVVAMPKLIREGFCTCTIHVEYEWKPHRYACCKVFGHVQDECPKNIGSGVTKNLKNPSQAPRGVTVGPKNVRSSSTSAAPIVEKIDKLERLIIDGKITLVDDEGKPLKKVEYSGDHDSEDEVEPIDNEMASFLASKRVGYDTNSLLEQWMDNFENVDCDYDPYDDDMYEGQEIHDNIQSIYDNLDIKVANITGEDMGFTIIHCVGSDNLLWKVITQLRVISGNHLCISVVYVLTTPIPKDGENATVDQIRRRAKKELWDSLKAKYMAEDTSSKKFLHTLNHKKEELTLVELGSCDNHGLIRYNDNKGKRKHHDNTRVDPNKKAKPTCWKCGKTGYIKRDSKGVNVGNKAKLVKNKFSVGWVHPTTERLNIVYDNIASAFMSTFKLNDSILWHARLGHVHFKRMEDMSKDGLILAFNMDTENNLCDLHATPSLGNKKYFVTFIDDASRTESGLWDEIFDENRFSSIPRPSLRIPNGTEDVGGLVVPKKVIEEVVQQPKPELRKSKRNRSPKNFRPEFQLYLIEGTRDDVSDQNSYCFNVEDDPKTFDEVMKSQDVAF